MSALAGDVARLAAGGGPAGWVSDESEWCRTLRDTATQYGLSSVPPAAAVHALRHTSGSLKARRGEPIHNIAALMGSASLSTTQGYLASVGEDLAATLDRQADVVGF
ncbi:MAG: site-specific integrase [Acidimicrobiaceae bacterium]|nr:site-specific integrase [Acidimicrobiaceae bacterium]